jgi:hypothetical protein
LQEYSVLVNPVPSDIAARIGRIPYRMALAGGWIDQPFLSRLNPEPPGSMVVVQIKPTCEFMDRAGMATGTRKVAREIWNDELPRRSRSELVRELYAAENNGRPDPSGSQDMVGLVYPGISRHDFDFRHDGGVFPSHIESCNDPHVARWLEGVLKILPVGPRPPGYDPLGEKRLEPSIIARLGKTGRDCYDAILRCDIRALGASMNACVECWAQLLPNVLRHPVIKTDLVALLRSYQAKYPGAMFSGCGGGYLYVVSEEPVPNSFSIHVRTEADQG